VNLDLVSALLAYRQRVFTMIPDSSRAVPEPSLRALLVRQAKRRKSLENDVRTGLTALTTLRRHTFARRKELARELTEAREDLEAAEAGRLVHHVAAGAPSPRKAPRFNLAPSPASVVPPATGVASNDASPWRLSLWIGVGWFAISSVMRTGTSYQRAIEDSPARERKPRVHTVPSPSASPPIKYGPAETPWAPRMRQAQSLAKDGKLTEARQAYEQLLETDAPQRFDLLLALASICTQLRDWRGAESAYSKALTLRPDDAAVAQNLEKTYRRLGQPGKAEALVRKAASLADARQRVQSGLNLMSSRRPTEGIAILRETTTLYPAYPEAYFYLGTALLGQDRIAESVPYLEKYVALSPDSESAEGARNLLAGYKPKVVTSK
jgi:tetratricopeptide (TPR) repeat protein